MSRIVAALVAAVSLLVLAGCGSFTSYAAEVNGERLTQNDLRRELDAILGNKKYLDRIDQSFSANSNGQEKVRGEGEGTFDTVFVAAVLDRRIGFALIHQEVERRKLKVSTKILDETRTGLEERYDKAIFRAFPKAYRDELVRVFAEQTVLQEALGTGAVDDEMVEAFYEANRQSFDQTCVRHVLVADEAAANAVKARLDAGEDFAAVAKAESTDNQGAAGGSAAQGGALGCIGPGAFVAEFEGAMALLQPGEVSGPVKTQFGFHIIGVTERKTKTLEEAAPEIRAQLESSAPDPLATYINEALAKAKIKVNPRYGTFVKEPSPGVKAPKLLDASTTSVPALPAPESSPTP